MTLHVADDVGGDDPGLTRARVFETRIEAGEHLFTEDEAACQQLGEEGVVCDFGDARVDAGQFGRGIAEDPKAAEAAAHDREKGDVGAGQGSTVQGGEAVDVGFGGAAEARGGLTWTGPHSSRLVGLGEGRYRPAGAQNGEHSGPKRPVGARAAVIRRLSASSIGPDATNAELALAWGAAAGAGLAQGVYGASLGWSGLQLAVAVIFAADVGGGVVVNATRSGSLYWSRPERGSRAAFYAVHLHPFGVALLWPELGWTVAAGLYAAVMACAAIVTATPTSLKRPVAALLTAVGLVLAPLAALPEGLGWLPGLLLLKLIVGHAVPVEPVNCV